MKRRIFLGALSATGALGALVVRIGSARAQGAVATDLIPIFDQFVADRYPQGISHQAKLDKIGSKTANAIVNDPAEREAFDVLAVEAVNNLESGMAMEEVVGQMVDRSAPVAAAAAALGGIDPIEDDPPDFMICWLVVILLVALIVAYEMEGESDS